MAGNSMLVEFSLTRESDERTRLRVTESGHELRDWPEAEKQRYSDDHQDGWGAFLDRLTSVVLAAVSYTHLDVYKRQVHMRPRSR